VIVLCFAIFGEERSPLLLSGFEFRALYKIINRNCMPVRASPHTHTLELHVRISRGHMLQEEKAVIALAGSAPQGWLLSAQQWLTETSGEDADRSSVLIVQW